jgi:lipopolysaccharide/colanic/teichoic acid biosynthesis glycosyltransferase
MKILLIWAIIIAVTYEILAIFVAKSDCEKYVQKHQLAVSSPSISYSIAKRFGDIIISLMVCVLILPILYLLLGLII